MYETEKDETVTYDNLLEDVLSDDNIKKALKQVVGNKGASGVDGMTVYELAEWLPANIDALKEKIRAGKYKPQPVRRVEIPKPDGGTRNLGVPTVIDRLLQQAVAQVLTPIYETKFSEHSFGFRPNRSAHDAVRLAQYYYNEGYRFVVDIDLSKYFDTINHDMLMQLVRKDIKDKALVELIKRFLKSGILMPDGLLVRTEEGSPQGGNLSPLLANIYLHEFDMELERRGHRFVRYADDVNIYVRSRKSAERVMDSSVMFLEGKTMKLKVNREKSSVGSPTKLKFLGFRLGVRRDFHAVIVPHKTPIKRFKDRIRRITKRNRGRSIEQVLSELRTYMRGWIGYYGISESKHLFLKLDAWIRRKVRTYLFKQWKKPKNRYRELRKIAEMGPTPILPHRREANLKRIARIKSFWQASKAGNLSSTLMSNAYMHDKLGMYFMMDDWEKVQERCSNRPLPNGTMGGVRGRLAN
jgi:group II intron reverse transcriptase/maturase